ncbi:MAG: hypothetical protein E7047_05000 [Lentisphaerae bacterium]|nr:hypothetical protein [Lentisphaerota bacterium]
MNNLQRKKEVVILGLGGAGGRVVQTINSLPEAAGLRLCVFDTDRRALEQLELLPDNCKVLCDEQWLLGQGTGGDVMKGQRAIAREGNQLQQLMHDAALLLIVGGLGGGTATGGAGVISRMARSNNLTALGIFEMPFSFEGPGRSRAAENGLRELLALSDTVMGIPNDLLFSVLPAETGFADAFNLADGEFARAVLGIVDVISPGNLLSADIGDLAAILKSRKSYAAIGVGYGDSDEPGESCNQALTALLDSPFLGGAAKLKDADAVILNLTGGEALTINNVTRTLESAGALPGIAAKVMVGANVRPGMGSRVHITAVAIKYDERETVTRPVAEAAKPARRTRRREQSAAQPVQQMLPLTMNSCGIFEGRTPTIIDGVNFDVPAFVRRQVSIDTGE